MEMIIKAKQSFCISVATLGFISYYKLYEGCDAHSSTFLLLVLKHQC